MQLVTIDQIRKTIAHLKSQGKLDQIPEFELEIKRLENQSEPERLNAALQKIEKNREKDFKKR